MIRSFLPAALLAAGLAAPVAAEPFTLFIYEPAADLALRVGDGPATVDYWGAYGEFAAAATEAGVLRGGSALHADQGVATLRAGAVAQAAYVAPDLALGGYFQLDVPDITAAIDWAGRLPAARTGAVEVRTGYPAPAM